MGNGNHKILKTASIITLITLFSKVFGFVREILIAFFFGTSTEVDIYLMAVNIPTVILGFISCVGTAYTPVYTDINVREGNKKSLRFTTYLIISMAIICGILILFCSIFSPQIVRIAAPGFSQSMVQTTSSYLKISLWNLLITTIMNILICYLNCNGKFVHSSMCMLFHSSVQIVFTVLANFIGPVFLTIGYVVANICYLIALLFVSMKGGFRFATPYYNRQYSKMLIRLWIPVSVSALVTQINGYVDKYYASGLVEGSISALHYSNTIRTFVVMMLNTGLVTMFFPLISRLVSEDKVDEVKKTLLSSIKYVIIVFIPITVLLMTFSTEITQLLFERGAFRAESVSLTSAAIRMYAIGITAVALRDIFFNYFYAVKDSLFTLIVSVVGILVNIVLNAIFVQKMGVSGLAMATSVAAFSSIPLLGIHIKHSLYKGGFEVGFVPMLFKCFLANIVPVIILLLVNRLFAISGIIPSVIESILYLLIYFCMLKSLKVNEVKLVEDVVVKLVSKVIKKKR